MHFLLDITREREGEKADKQTDRGGLYNRDRLTNRQTWRICEAGKGGGQPGQKTNTDNRGNKQIKGK